MGDNRISMQFSSYGKTCDVDVASYLLDRGGVFDPFMGSGTTGVACAMVNRPFIGVEINESYFNIAVKRISEASKQPGIF